MAIKPKKPSRLKTAMLKLAADMRRIGAMDDATYRKLTVRDVDRSEARTLPSAHDQ